jgi:hypothetical protein
VAELGGHHGAAADGAAQGAFVDDGPDLGRFGAGEQVLAVQAQADPAVDLGGGGAGVAEQGDGAGVAGGLEQAVDELQLEGADDGGGGFQAEVGLEPAGRDVAVAGPPAGGAGLADQGQDLVAGGGAGDAVEGEQVGDVAFFEPDPAVLHPADL